MLHHRDHHEYVLSLIWEQVLGVAPASWDASLDGAGGADEVAAVLAEVERRLAVAVTVEELGTMPTLADLAAHVLATRMALGLPQRPVLLADNRPEAVPLVYVHGVAGELMFDHRLLRFDMRRPVIGIRSIGMDLEEEPLQTIDAMAERYVADLEAIGLGEPFVIAGASSSATIAFAMAQHLEATGRLVAYVGLLEPPPPILELELDLAERVQHRLREQCQLADVDFDPDRVEEVIAALVEADELPAARSVDLALRRAEVFAHNQIAGYRHVPPARFEGHAVLYESRAFGCGPDPVGNLEAAARTADADEVDPSDPRGFERFWSRYLRPETLVRRQRCDHRGIDATMDTRIFLRDDIQAALDACGAT